MPKLLSEKKQEKGQALLIVLLTMAVILTVVLSVISRSVTDISTTTYSEEALRAFSAAEAGVEKALIIGTDVSENIGDASFVADISGLAEGLASFNYPVDVNSGESIYLWFVSHDADSALVCNSPSLPCYAGSRLQFCWGRSGTAADANSPAVEISVFYDTSQAGVGSGNFSAVKVARTTFDPFAGRSPANSFQAAQGSCSVDGTGYAFSGSVNLATLGIPCLGTSGCLLTARVRTLYNNLAQPIGLNVEDGTLPSQGKYIESIGTTTSQASKRKIQAYRTYGGPPPIFDAAVFSEQSVVKP